MKDRLQLLNFYKTLIGDLECIIVNIDNKYRPLKTKTMNILYEILELLYFINRLEFKKRKYYQNKVLSKISVLDYFFYQLFLKRQISKEKYQKISLQLLSFTKQVYGWMKYESNL